MEEFEGITVKIPTSQLEDALNKAAAEMFKSSYSNPMIDLLTKSIKENEGTIKKIVDSIIVEAIGSAEFKTKMADIVIQRMVESALKK
jgi:hypothetical protein